MERAERDRDLGTCLGLWSTSLQGRSCATAANMDGLAPQDDVEQALLLQDFNWDLPEDLSNLSTLQLCLVRFHPLASEASRNGAELAYWRRRALFLNDSLDTV